MDGYIMKITKEQMVFIGVIGLVTGNLIGAGILALPINLGLAGLFPSLIMILVYGSMMYFSAIVLADEAMIQKSDTFDYPSLYGAYLGKAGKWIAVVTNIIILYGLLIAYITGGGKILMHVLGIDPGQYWFLLLFGGILSLLTLCNQSKLQKFNVALLIIMILCFFFLLIMGERHAHFRNMSYYDFWLLPATIPLIVTAFHFHNIIPAICHTMQWNRKKICKAMLYGMLCALFFNVLWVQTGICSVPPYRDKHDMIELAEEYGMSALDASKVNDTLIEAYNEDTPITIPMGEIVEEEWFLTLATIFSMIAVVTSFLANGLGLMNFIRDIFYNSFKIHSQLLVKLAAFVPPLVIAILWPDVFLKALGVVGGIGIVTLFGILPSIIAIIKKSNPRWKRCWGGVFLVCSCAALLVAVALTFKMIELTPKAEYFQNQAMSELMQEENNL